MTEDAAADPATQAWHLDKRVPIALIFTIVLQTSAIAWWASKIETRVERLEKDNLATSDNSDRLTRLEVKIDAQNETLVRIDRRLEREDDRRARR